MSSKSLIYIFMAIGSYGGGLIPLFWGGSTFSFSSIILGMVGGIFGIWIGFKLSQNF